MSSDPAASAQNNLQRQFWGDYNTLVSKGDTAWFIYTDSRHGVGCPAVDAYQRFLVDIGRRSSKKRSGRPTEGRQGRPGGRRRARTADDCPAQFGNTDVFVSVITTLTINPSSPRRSRAVQRSLVGVDIWGQWS